MREPDGRRARTVLALLLAVSLVLVVVDARGGEDSPLRSWRSTAGDVLGPVQRAATAVASPVGSLVERVRGLREDGERIEALEAEVSALRLEQRTEASTLARVEAFEEVMRLAGAGQYRVVPAQIVGFGPSQGFARTVTVDVGSLDGLTPDMTVVSGDGLVGRVTVVSRTTATVLLLVDPTAGVGVRLEGDLRPGLVTGEGGDRLSLEVLDPATPVEPGDRLVTFGSREGSPFVPGVPVGEVLEVRASPGARTKRAVVQPYVDPEALDVVGVVVEPPRTDPRDAVLPPPPAARP